MAVCIEVGDGGAIHMKVGVRAVHHSTGVCALLRATGKQECNSVNDAWADRGIGPLHVARFTLTLFRSLPFITLCPVIHMRGGKLETSEPAHVWHAGFPYFNGDIPEVGDEFVHFIQVSS